MFHCDGDSGKTRLSATPSPEIIHAKLNAFVAKWADVADGKGVKLFKSDTVAALENLKHHISAGCLSEIPPGGTNRNEQLHEHINSFFKRSKIGILLAYALLTVIMHAHNTSVKVGGKLLVRPITASPLRGTHSTNTKPIGIMPKERLREQDLQTADHWEIDISDNTMDFGLILPIYLKSLQKLQILRGLRKVNLTRLSAGMQQFKEFLASKIGSGEEISSQTHSKLSEYGLTLHTAPRNGNCFFTAIAINIMADLDNWSPHLHRLDVFGNMTMNVETLSVNLRQKFVEELIGERRHMYEDFIVQDESYDYIAEAKKFLQDGFYANSHGDLMPLAMATLLQASLIIITTHASSNPMYVTPMVGSANTSVFLVYSPTGTGHYDAALPYSITVQQPTANTKSTHKDFGRCRRGVNKTSGKSCAPSALYTTRCKCYLSSQACGSLCSCKGCSNPCGVRQCNPQGIKRQRRSHSLQKEIPSSKKFALDRGESLSTAIWSDFESIVLEEISASEQQDESMIKLFNDIVYYSKSSFCTIPLTEDIVFREKTSSQISAKIEHIYKSMLV